MPSSPWRILLIAGSSGAGKTNLALALATKLGVSVVQVDDLRIALQACSNESTNADLHIFTGSERAHHFAEAQRIKAGLVRVAEAVEPAIRAVMSHHIDVEAAGPIIIEGDGILPRIGSIEHLARADGWFARVTQEQIRAVVVQEPDLAQLSRNIAGRKRGADTALDQNPETASEFARGSSEFARYLANMAKDYSIPVVETKPFETLVERVAMAFGIELDL